MEKTYLLITFPSTHAAMAMERLLKKSLSIIVMPVLREISSSCGMAIKLDVENYEKLMDMIKENNLKEDTYTIYKIVDTGTAKEITAL